MTLSVVLTYLLSYGSAVAVVFSIKYAQRKEWGINKSQSQASRFVFSIGATLLLFLVDPYIRLYEDAYAVEFSEEELYPVFVLMILVMLIGSFAGFFAGSSVNDRMVTFVSRAKTVISKMLLPIVVIFLILRTFGQSFHTGVGSFMVWVSIDIIVTYFFLWFLYGFFMRLLASRGDEEEDN